MDKSTTIQTLKTVIADKEAGENFLYPISALGCNNFDDFTEHFGEILPLGFIYPNDVKTIYLSDRNRSVHNLIVVILQYSFANIGIILSYNPATTKWNSFDVKEIIQKGNNYIIVD